MVREINKENLKTQLLLNLLDSSLSDFERLIDLILKIETTEYQINMKDQFLIPEAMNVSISRVFNNLYEKKKFPYESANDLIQEFFELIIKQLNYHYNLDFKKYIIYNSSKFTIQFLTEKFEKDFPDLSRMIPDEIENIINSF